MIDENEKTALILKAMAQAAGVILGLKYLEARLDYTNAMELEKAATVFRRGWGMLNRMAHPSKQACIPCREKEKADA